MVREPDRLPFARATNTNEKPRTLIRDSGRLIRGAVGQSQHPQTAQLLCHAAQTRRATAHKPYGERVATINLTVAPEDREDKGRSRERFDPETNLQHLNARTYDPDLGLFLQSDWWEVT